MNIDLKMYLDENILTKYDDNVGGHGIEHIKYVIERSFEIVEEFKLDVDLNIVYTVAMFHDIGYMENPEEHHIVSANMFLEDNVVKEYFSLEEINIIYEAIIDHRASLEYDARSIYGKIVSSADREIDVDRLLTRSLSYAYDKYKDEDGEIDVDVYTIIDDSYNKISKKYGTGGYAKIFYEDKKYKEFINKIRFLTDNKEKFIEYELELLDSLS